MFDHLGFPSTDGDLIYKIKCYPLLVSSNPPQCIDHHEGFALCSDIVSLLLFQIIH